MTKARLGNESTKNNRSGNADGALQNSASLEAPGQFFDKLSAPSNGLVTVLKLVGGICAGHSEAVTAGAYDDPERFGESTSLMRNLDCGGSAS